MQKIKSYGVENKKEKIHFYTTIKKMKYSDKKLIQSILNKEKDPEFLFSIIIVEKMNRGSIFFLEKLLSRFFPKLILFFDCSIGPSQIKPSTAKKVVDFDDAKLVKTLINPKNNIEIMCQLIKVYERFCKTNEEILNYYLTGKKNPAMNYQLTIYHCLTAWSSKNKLYKKSLRRMLCQKE